MTSRRAQRRGRRLRGHDLYLEPDAWYGFQPAWARDADAIPQARQVSHDSLIARMGANRTGPVVWRTFQGDDAKAFLTTFGQDYQPGSYEADQVRQLKAHLREYGGFIVLAMATGTPPEASSSGPDVPIVST